MRSKVSLAAFVLVALGCACATKPQTPPKEEAAPADRAPSEFRRLASEAADLFESGRSDDARRRLDAAHVLVPGPSAAPQAPGTDGPPLDTPKRKASYAVGVFFGRQMGEVVRQNELDIDADALARGVRDITAGAAPALSNDEIGQIMTALQQAASEREGRHRADLAEGNRAKGDNFLATNGKRQGVVTLQSGLQYQVIKDGNGPTPKVTDVVIVNYRGTLIDGTEFDSSYRRGQPAEFQVRGVISGWTEALQLMKAGSKWMLYIPSGLAYGEGGKPPKIGPNETLVFEVELLGVKP